jgi:hypothetical protein
VFYIQIHGQTLSTQRSKPVYLFGDSINIDTMSVIPGTVVLYEQDHTVIPDSLYSVNYDNALIFPDSSLPDQNVHIYYHVFDVDFTKEYYHKDPEQYRFDSLDAFRFSRRKTSSTFLEDFAHSKQLDTRGNITRGISVGNNQNVFVNSNLNLQLSGAISDEFNISAAITDKNIPIQPGGYTQQIQDFDRVFISLYNDNTRLTFGDLQLNASTGQFMRFDKKMLGGRFERSFYMNANKKDTLHSSFTGAVSKGKFMRFKFTGIEGNQGPYRLRGQNGETGIIILAGSEKVYIDGILMQRGEENDYVMNYNTAEITFTTNQLITKDKRIIVEYLYSQRSYTRFIVHTNQRLHTSSGNYWVNVYSEGDAKNQTLQQDLNAEQKEIMSQIGDNLDLAVVPNVDTAKQDDEGVLYIKKDTTVGTETYTIFVYSTSSDSNRYRVGFRYVGENNGNYRLIQSSANGRVYQWIAPQNGQSGGDYTYTRTLVTPKTRQLITIGGEQQITKNINSSFEAALSNQDLNTFSSLDHQDNKGFAFKYTLDKRFTLSNSSHIKAEGGYQLINRHFRTPERYRDVEFERDWNVENAESDKNEHMEHFGLDFSNENLGNASVKTSIISRQKEFTGVKTILNSDLFYNGFSFDASGSYLKTHSNLHNTNFLRYYATLSKSFPFMVIGLNDDLEDNKWYALNDSLVGNSFYYHKYGAFITSPDTSENQYKISYSNRNDYLPYQNNMRHSSRGEEYEAFIGLLSNPAHTFKANMKYRILDFYNSDNADKKPENSLLTRIQHTITPFQSVLFLSTLFEAGSGLESRTGYEYIKVERGQGLYIWKDYDEDGTKDLDEFEKESFNDMGEYIRISLPTNEYIQTYNNQFNQIVRINPSQLWDSPSGFKKIISRFSEHFAYKIINKNTKERLINAFNPFYAYDDSVLVSNSVSFRNNLNYTAKNWTFGYYYNKSRQKELLLNGFNTKQNTLNQLQVRWDVNNRLSFENHLNDKISSVKSDFFESKNYTLHNRGSNFICEYQPGNSVYFTFTYQYVKKKNTQGNEWSGQHHVGTNLRYHTKKDGKLSGSIDYINIQYPFVVNTPVAYEMLEGLLPGNNFTWQLSFQQSVTSVIEILLSYEGRKTKNNLFFHQGNVQIRANF